MSKHLTTGKFTHTALRHARVLAAFTGERMYQVVERVLAEEMLRLGFSTPSSTDRVEGGGGTNGARPPMGDTER